MKKSLLKSIFLIILISVGVIILISVRFSSKQEVAVALPINEISPQITNLRNWSKWFPYFKKIDSTQIKYSHSDSVVRGGNLTLRKIAASPGYIDIVEENNNDHKKISIQLYPDSFGFATRLIWSEQTSLLIWLKNKFGFNKNQNALAFQYFADNTALFFGFDIRIQPVEDTLILTKKAVCLRSSSLLTLKSLYQDIFDFAAKKNILINSNENRLAAFSLLGNDSIMVMAGIPVKSKSLVYNEISYLEMPAKGRMLVGYYEGPYSGIAHLYESMNRYVLIRSLSRIAAPFEKYITSPQTSSDSLHMKIKLFYPIL